MAEGSVDPEPEWSDWALDSAEDTLVAIETLLATLRAFEDVLRQQDISVFSSTEYCDNFCQALMHYAGGRNSMEHGLPLLEVYCLSINCFASARSHLTAESDRVTLVLKRLALSCFELLLSVPENEIPVEAWIQFHQSVQLAHDALLRYGSTDLQALLQITGEGGAWSSPVLSALLTGQLADTGEVNAYISLEGEGFMEMRVKHLEKLGEVAKAVVLAKACSECSAVSNQAMFRQTFVSLLCHLLPSEEAITEISRLDCKDVLEITGNLETEGEENTAFILCTTFLTQQLQQQSLHSSWDLMIVWSKLQRRLDPSLMSLLERCLQLGAIAKTVLHLLHLVRVIEAEVEELGTPASVELCVKALQLPKQEDSETRICVCKTLSRLLSDDLEVLRACQLTEFLLGPSQDSFTCLEQLYLRSDQKDHEKGLIPNSLRCELLLALKTYWPFDPEFWDWKTLKYECASLIGLKLGYEEEEEQIDEHFRQSEVQEVNAVKVELEEQNPKSVDNEQQNKAPLNHQTEIKGKSKGKNNKFYCQICRRSVSGTQIVHHSKRHAVDICHPCPVCLDKFKSRKELLPHLEKHLSSDTPLKHSNIRKEDAKQQMDEDDDIEPGEITVDPSLMLYYKSTHDPDVLDHIVEQTKTVQKKQADDDEYITFEYIHQHFQIQNREKYPCPGTGCNRVFKHSKYLYVHLKSEHIGDENVKHFHQVRDKREKCLFCKRHFVSAYHSRKHRRVHYRERPYTCLVVGCCAQFKTSNELVTHKKIHDYQLMYQCELGGCCVTYSDLGQVYHHEAQHFRDAAFTCTSTNCKKYYFSKKEFVKHLSTHNITFSEEDFKAQRKSKQKLLQTDTVSLDCEFKDCEMVNEAPLNSEAVLCESTLQHSGSTEPKTTLVAVCFDGSKFTCGFEKCGMSFSRARDVQRHLKCAHPEHLKLENKTHRQDGVQESRSKVIKTKSESGTANKRNVKLPPARKTLAAGTALCPPQSPERNSSVLPKDKDMLDEVMMRLSQLNLNSASPCNITTESIQSNLDTSLTEISHQEILAKPPVVLLQKRADLLGAVANQEMDIQLLATAKPFVCPFEKKCDFRTAESFSLRRHLGNKHGCTYSQARAMTSLETTDFRPYVCLICSKSHRQKCLLRNHYINMHKLSESRVNKIVLSPVKSEWNEEPTAQTKETSESLTVTSLKEQCPDVKEDSTLFTEDEQNSDSASPSKEEGEKKADKAKTEDVWKRDSDDETKPSLRTTRRLGARTNLCYVLNKFSKPFDCVAKNCDAAFSTQGGLVRHLQIVHHYNRSQLLMEKDLDMPGADVRKETGKKRPHSTSDEPQPRFKCHFADCSSSYHLKSSLARHTRACHTQAPELLRCQYNGCTKMFSRKDLLKKHTLKEHTLYSHCQFYDSLVVRLQSTHKKSINGCQKKLIVPPLDPQTKERRKAPRQKPMKKFVFRSHEEALQMCQDRCMPVAFPCMVKHCDSVVAYTCNLHRHYRRVHSMSRCFIVKNEKELVFTAEKLEEIIQKKSVPRAVAGVCTLNGVHKVDALNAERLPPPENLHAKADQEQANNSLGLPEEPPAKRKGIFLGADVVIKGKPSSGGHHEQHLANSQKRARHLGLDQIRPLLRPLTIDLSPPCSLLIKAREGFQAASNNNAGRKLINGSNDRDGGELMNGCNNEEGGESVKSSNSEDDGALVNGFLPSPSVGGPSLQGIEPVQPSLVEEIKPCCPSPNPLNPSAFKPLGFESSFLKFIQDAPSKDKHETPGIPKHTSDHYSKTIDHLGMANTPSRSSFSSLLKPNAVIGELTSVQNLKSFMDEALSGCGDLAMKQLQYLTPVVVLERPVCSTTLPDLLQAETNKSKLLLGS